jgi:synaptotagmin-6
LICIFVAAAAQVLDADKSCDISGELKVILEDMDLSKSNEIWGDIVKVKRQTIDRPELLVSLNYLPQAARLTINITKAKNLEAEDLFVKVLKFHLRTFRAIKHEIFLFFPLTQVYLIQNGKRVKKKKTEIARKAYNEHIWNEAFTFNLPGSNFHNSGLEVNKYLKCIKF